MEMVDKGFSHPTLRSDKLESGANVFAGPQCRQADGEETQGTLDRNGSATARRNFANGDGVN